MPLAGETELAAITRNPEAPARISVGVMSPLWGLFAGAAVSGAAWWWMTRWARPANLEAIFGAAQALPVELEAKVEALAAPVADAIEAAPAILEAAVEPVIEAVEEAPAVVEAAVEPAIEAVAEATAAVEALAETVGAAVGEPVPAAVADAVIEAAPEPVIIEDEPVSPVLEALADVAAKPAPRARKTATKVTPSAD